MQCLANICLRHVQDIKPEVEKESMPTDKVYEKDDFFDQLSCEALERLTIGSNSAAPGGGKPPPRARFAEQRKLDIETFGGTGIARRSSFGRGRGRRGVRRCSCQAGSLSVLCTAALLLLCHIAWKFPANCLSQAARPWKLLYAWINALPNS